MTRRFACVPRPGKGGRVLSAAQLEEADGHCARRRPGHQRQQESGDRCRVRTQGAARSYCHPDEASAVCLRRTTWLCRCVLAAPLRCADTTQARGPRSRASLGRASLSDKTSDSFDTTTTRRQNGKKRARAVIRRTLTRARTRRRTMTSWTRTRRAGLLPTMRSRRARSVLLARLHSWATMT